MLFHAGKLMELGGKRLALTKAGQKALNGAPEKTLKRCGNIGSKQPDSMSCDELRASKDKQEKPSASAVAGRRSVITNAKDCPVGRWLNFNLFRYMVAAGYDFGEPQSGEFIAGRLWFLV